MTELREVVVQVSGRPPTPNDRTKVAAWHWRQLAGWKARAAAIAREQLPDGFGDPVDRCELDVVFLVPTRARHDIDNLIASQKPTLDGLVDAGVLRDDSTDVIVESRWRARYERGIVATIYTVRELPSTERLGL